MELISESVAQPSESQDFCVFTSKEAKSDPTAQLSSCYQVLPVEKDNDDSLELELIPQIFFAEVQDDDSIHFELLILSFFFAEEKNCLVWCIFKLKKL